MPIAHIRPGRTSTAEREQKKKRSLTATLATLATIATVAAIALSLLGYGVALAVENMFGVPHAQIFTSSTDLLSLSTWAIVEIFNMHFWDLVAPLRKSIGLSALALSIFTMAYWVFLARKDLWPNMRWWRLRKKRGPEKLRRFLMWMTPVTGLFGAGLICVFYGFLFVGLFVVITAIGALPSIGMTTGKSFLEKNVVAPQVCTGVRSREALMKKHEAEKRPIEAKEKKNIVVGASCVQVLHDGKLLAQGRVAISTTGFLVLFDPASGQVQRVPTHDSIVEPVSSLE